MCNADVNSGERRLLACSRRQLADDVSRSQSDQNCIEHFGKLPKRTGWQPVLPSNRDLLRAPEAHGANQSPPLMPTQPKNTEKAACNSRRLGNDGALNTDIVDDVLHIAAV